MLLKTDKSMGPDFGKYISAITMPLMDDPTETYESLDNFDVIAVGWGIFDFQVINGTGEYHQDANGDGSPEMVMLYMNHQLKRLNTRVVPVNECREVWNEAV